MTNRHTVGLPGRWHSWLHTVHRVCLDPKRCLCFAESFAPQFRWIVCLEMLFFRPWLPIQQLRNSQRVLVRYMRSRNSSRKHLARGIIGNVICTLGSPIRVISLPTLNASRGNWRKIVRGYCPLPWLLTRDHSQELPHTLQKKRWGNCKHRSAVNKFWKHWVP